VPRNVVEHNKTPGPDGFPIEFYQNFWEIIKHSVKNIFDDFDRKKLDVRRLNYGNIYLSFPQSPVLK
jgi:hypothetical protein